MARDFDAIIRPIITPLVENPDSIIIREIPGNSQKETTVLIVSEDDDTARLIGKKGVVANALREVVGIATKADNSNTRIHLKFESFKENEEKEETDGK